MCGPTVKMLRMYTSRSKIGIQTLHGPFIPTATTYLHKILSAFNTKDPRMLLHVSRLIVPSNLRIPLGI